MRGILPQCGLVSNCLGRGEQYLELPEGFGGDDVEQGVVCHDHSSESYSFGNAVMSELELFNNDRQLAFGQDGFSLRDHMQFFWVCCLSGTIAGALANKDAVRALTNVLCSKAANREEKHGWHRWHGKK